MAELKKKLVELLDYMEATRARLFECARQMNPSLAMVRPRADMWSAAENLAHLALVEDSVTGLMTKSIHAARGEGVGPDTTDESFMSSLDRWRLPDNEMKVVAPARITPDNTKSISDSMASLVMSRERLRDLLISNADIDLSSIKRPHLLLKELDMFQWALFVAQHEERHRRQMERAIDLATERAAECAPIV